MRGNNHRFRKNHLENAAIEIRIAVREMGEASPRPSGLPNTNKRFSPAVGDTYGDLTLLSKTVRGPHIYWRCRCVCGAECSKQTSALNRNARRKSVSSCENCSREKKNRIRESYRDLLQEGFRKQFVDYQTLWLPYQVRHLEDLIRDDLIREFGELVDELPRSFRPAVGYPYSASDRPDVKYVPRSPTLQPSERYRDVTPWTKEDVKPVVAEMTDAVLGRIERFQNRKQYAPSQNGAQIREPWETKPIITVFRDSGFDEPVEETFEKPLSYAEEQIAEARKIARLDLKCVTAIFERVEGRPCRSTEAKARILHSLKEMMVLFHEDLYASAESS